MVEKVQRLMVRCDDCGSVAIVRRGEGKKGGAKFCIVYRTDSNTYRTVIDISIRLTKLHL